MSIFHRIWCWENCFSSEILGLNKDIVSMNNYDIKLFKVIFRWYQIRKKKKSVKFTVRIGIFRRKIENRITQPFQSTTGSFCVIFYPQLNIRSIGQSPGSFKRKTKINCKSQDLNPGSLTTLMTPQPLDHKLPCVIYLPQ